MERRHVDVAEAHDETDLPDLFTAIYRTNRWGSGETRSGPGSEVQRMKRVITQLGDLVRELEIRSVLDAPCGDFNWMQYVDLGGAGYTGGDIVEELIADNAARHEAPGRSFQLLDFTAERVPRVDLILCRDALVHFSYQHVIEALTRFRESGSRFLLTTTFAQTRTNTDILTGWWRPINLRLAPFGLPEPLRVLSDEDSDDFYDDKTLALWDLRQIPSEFPYEPAGAVRSGA
ncbi:class I SAM-dependent methyltransferase [Streptomyces sp. ISL-100]|uniref:class I SAM-dependent methyltransferase n=1 Tax=Streptomyces sp. ISL-100 TaxID=2819173 RepID=UPI001BE5EA93|nr:class I SAM-dependent methyltransferase [Streptomyces sp. ISL-100]MBT2401240.1 class I SAM-dependent methyltransferase [Streptomyces sp. ISL-100]